MALTASQYNSIMRQYEERQTRNRHILEDRRRRIYDTVPGYRELEESVAAVSLEQGKKMLSGDDAALNDLREKLNILSRKKAELLVQNGYPEDFLQPLYDCPDCRDTGYGNGEKCHCFRQAEIDLLYEQSNLKQILEQENFGTLSYRWFAGETLSSYQATVDKCKKFVRDFKTCYQNLFFYGTVGTGKTFLTNCIAKECLDMGCSVIYFSAANLFDLLTRSAYRSRNQEEGEPLSSGLYQCDLLVIDDLGTETTTALTLSLFFTCLNERLLRRKPVIISTNLSLEDCRNRYQDRIFSRIASNFEFCKLTGPDIRMCKKIPKPPAQSGPAGQRKEKIGTT